MRKWLLVVLALFLSTGVVSAQEATPPIGPISTLEAGDFRALAITADGDRLLVADADNMQVRIYDFTDPTKPELLKSLDVSGTPVLLAGGEDYGLAAVTTDGETDTIEIVAPAIPNAPYSAGANYIDIDKNPLALALSPDNHWGIALSEHGYTLMQVNGPSDVTSIEVPNAFIDAALSNTTAYYLRDQNLDSATLDSVQAMSADQTLALGGTPSLVTLNAAVTQGAVVVDGSQIVFFDPVKLQKTGTFTLKGSPITSIHYLTKNSTTEYLIITQQDANTITVLNAANPQKAALLPAVQPLNKAVHALAIFKQYLVVTDGITINIFAL